MAVDFSFLNSIQLISAKAHHFKGFDEVELKFEEKVTQFIGDNSKGKSSIADLVAFAFLGTNFFGEKLDFFKQGENFAWVEVVFKDNLGNQRILRREITKDKSGKTSTTIRLDHYNVPSTKMKKAIDDDLFLSIVNPKYFLNLTPSAAKNMLCSIITIDRDTVEGLLDEESAEAVIALDYSIFDVDEKRSSISKEIKELESYRKELEIRLSDTFDKEIPEELTFDEAEFVETIKDLDFSNPIAYTRLKELLEERDKVMQHNAIRNYLIEQKQDFDENIEMMKDDLNKTVSEIDSLKATHSGLERFKRKYLELVVKEINSRLDKVSIQLLDKATDGSDKEVFYVRYDGKNINTCSNTEQVRAGIELHKMLTDLTHLKYPLIIDNAEGITILPSGIKSFHQTITLAVVKGYDLSYVGEDNIVTNVKTLKTMGRLNPEDICVYRVFGDIP